MVRQHLFFLPAATVRKRVWCRLFGHRVYVVPDIVLQTDEETGIKVHEWQPTGEATCTRCNAYLGPVGRESLYG